MNQQLDLLSVGDASLDVFIAPTESETQCRLDNKECVICFSYGDKIPVSSLEISVGGNASNNSVGTRRLGVKSSIVITLGDDSFSNTIYETLNKEGVDLKYVSRQQNSSTNYSTIVTYTGERTIFAYHAPRDYIFPNELPVSSWMYLTSMGKGFETFYNNLYQWLMRESSVKLAFNPGSWQFKAGVEVLKPILSRTHVLFVNREEAEKLTGIEAPVGKEKELLTKLSLLGPKINIVTDGGNGSYVYDGNSFIHAGVLPVDAYERTGAGDAFGSGFLSGIIRGMDIETALIWGTVNSASVIGYTGSQKGLLHTEEIEEWVNRFKSSNVILEHI